MELCFLISVGTLLEIIKKDLNFTETCLHEPCTCSNSNDNLYEIMLGRTLSKFKAKLIKIC